MSHQPDDRGSPLKARRKRLKQWRPIHPMILNHGKNLARPQNAGHNPNNCAPVINLPYLMSASAMLVRCPIPVLPRFMTSVFVFVHCFVSFQSAGVFISRNSAVTSGISQQFFFVRTPALRHQPSVSHLARSSVSFVVVWKDGGHRRRMRGVNHQRCFPFYPRRCGGAQRPPNPVGD